MELSYFQKQNDIRSQEVFGHPASTFDVAFWATCVAGETGEMCNLIKKQMRGDDLPDYKKQLANEMGDIVAYLCMLAIYQDIDLEKACIDKFNFVNAEAGRTDLDIDTGTKKIRDL